MRSDPSAYAIRLQQVLFGILLLGLGAMATQSMMRGGTGDMRTLVGGIVGITVLLLMDRHYWMLCPLGFWCGGAIAIPGVQAAELGCMAVIGAHFVRRALHRESHNVFRPAVFWVAPYFIWVVVIYIMNPSGIYLFGSTTIGARFYLKILLAFWAAMVLSVQRLDENDCRRLFHSTLVLLALGFVAKVVGWGFAAADTTADTTAYELLGAAALLYWLFARYRLSRFLQLNWLPFAAVLLAAVTLYTGKRRAAANVFLFPVIRSLVTRQDRGTALVLGTILAVTVAFVVAGQGRLYELPTSMQRSLSVLPGKWDGSVAQYAGGKDPFREIVHGYAWDVVRRNPWFGRKGFAIDAEELRWIAYSTTSQSYEGHGTSSNWHSTWLGMMADLGVLGPFSWFLFSVGMLLVGFRKLRGCADGSYQQTVVIYATCTYVLMLLASRTSGHSALLPFFYWPIFGLVLGITPPPEAARLDRTSRLNTGGAAEVGADVPEGGAASSPALASALTAGSELQSRGQDD